MVRRAWGNASLPARAHEERDVRVIEARNAAEARALAQAERGPGTHPEAHMTWQATRVVELDEPPLRIHHRHPARDVGLDRHRVRAMARDGAAPSEILARLAPPTPLEGMRALAEAFCVELDEVMAAGALLRGEIDRERADAALAPAKETRAHEWRFALAVREAVERDVVPEPLAAEARARGALATIRALVDAAGLHLSEGKLAIALLDALGPRVTQPGALSRTLAEVRAARGAPR